MRERRDRQGGFTLLELLMVVIIIAILASIALPQYFRVTERARTAQVLQLLASIRGSELRFKAMDPANTYEATLGAGSKLDIAPLPVPPDGWGEPALAGANVQSTRSAGVNAGSALAVNLDNGKVCATGAAAAADWNVPGC